MKNRITDFLGQKVPHTVVVGLLFLIVIPALVFGFWYMYKSVNELSSQISILSKNIEQLEFKFSSTTSALKENINQTKNSLSDTLLKEKQDVKTKFSDVQNKVGDISGSVTDLEKLNKLDSELLKKYSKVSFLNEHYTPSELVEISNKYEYYEEKDHQFHNKVWPFLKNMLEAAKADGIELYVYSAYRSFDTQEALKDRYKIVYGQEANQFSADQGYSEHQLGTAVDLITTGIDGTLKGFSKTQGYKWLLNNAYKFGFTLSYPENNGYYIYESWHWRFVGVELWLLLNCT